MTRGLHHVAIAVRDLDAAIARYAQLYGAQLAIRVELPEQGVDAAALALRDGSEVELIAPLASDGGVARFIETRGEGLHHMAFAVDDIRAELAYVAQAGGRLIDQEPRIGLHGVPVAFVHPSASFGVLIEFVELAAHGSAPHDR